MTFTRNADKNRTGKYSELIAITHFMNEGLQIAMPFGNQSGWDFLVKENGKWMEVQVKTGQIRANGGASCELSRCNGLKAAKYGKSRTYTEEDCDYIAAVLPECGSVWVIPIANAVGKRRLPLIQSTATARRSYLDLSSLPPAPVVAKLEQRTCKIRRALREFKPADRPDSVSAATWEMIELYLSGATVAQLLQRYGLKDRKGPARRFKRALGHFGYGQPRQIDG